MSNIIQKKILCVGYTCVDTVITCASYPLEDSDQRCLDERLQVGGNAANNCFVLRELSASCELLSSLSTSGQFSSFVFEEFQNSGIIIKNCPMHSGLAYPHSTCILNKENGSRTILHFKNEWPEISVETFCKLDLSLYSWIHFEGRNIKNVINMIRNINNWNETTIENSILVSVELEKPREEVSDLLPFGDVVFIGKDFAKFRNCSDMEMAVTVLSKFVKPSARVIVPWGDLGAIARNQDGSIVRSEAAIPSEVVDTLGAGDTFCAAVIFYLNAGKSLQESITFGCKVAGAKVGMYGYKGLHKLSKNFI